MHILGRQVAISSWLFMNGCAYLGARRANRATLRQQEGSAHSIYLMATLIDGNSAAPAPRAAYLSVFAAC